MAGSAELPPSLRLYDLRHVHATALLAADVHPKVAAERLRHSSVTLTLDTYTHAVAGLDADAAERLHRAIREPSDVDRETAAIDAIGRLESSSHTRSHTDEDGGASQVGGGGEQHHI